MMKRIIILRDGQTRVRLRKDLEKRLKTTCFRGKNYKLAGNFNSWGSFEEMLYDEAFCRCFMPILETALRRRIRTGMTAFNERMCIRCEKAVGWTSTVDVTDLVASHETEEFRLNNHAWGRRFVDLGEEAPQTSLVTLVLEIKEELMGWDVIIHTIYPGHDVGVLDGNVSERERVIFYQWESPGSPNPGYNFD